MAGDAEGRVKEIIRQVRKSGDAALIRYTQEYDGHAAIRVEPETVAAARSRVQADVLASLETACRRIESFHRRQLQNSWMQVQESGEILGQMVRPLQRVGIYVPGGKAAYPSSVLMNAVPARVAGVGEIIMVTPGSPSGIDPVILAAADMCGVGLIFQIGGAQAVAALAYGTESVPAVDKIVGPGNIYVATAKRLVYGDVDIDMIAGPSEILIVSDGSGEPAWVAADMLSQAEHDEMASSILVTIDEGFGRRVSEQISGQLAALPKKEIAEKALERYGAVIIAENLDQAADIANLVAPEHLELYVADPWGLLPRICNAGAIFMGYHTPEPVGDYVAGPNHVLPTGGTARFFSPLSVDDFIKKSSLVCFSEAALGTVADDVVRLARSENLDAHARSVAIRTGTAE